MSVRKDPFEGTGMTKQRYREVEDDIHARLTKEEVESGWFFSDAFDGLLVHKTWPEAEFD